MLCFANDLCRKRRICSINNLFGLVEIIFNLDCKKYFLRSYNGYYIGYNFYYVKYLMAYRLTIVKKCELFFEVKAI